MIIEPLILKGFRDSLPQKALERKKLIHTLEDTFESFGFLPIDTPVLEYKRVLLGKGGGETDKQIYEFVDKGKREVAMRFDLTVPFARFMAAHYNELYIPFKRYHIDKVWRGENTQRGRYREFIQCDFDIVGIDSSSADFEILLLMYSSFKNLGIENITIRLSHRGIFNRFLKKLGVHEHSVEIMRGVDKIAKLGRDKVLGILTDFLSMKNAAGILEYIEPEKTFSETLNKITLLAGGKADDTERLEEIYSYISHLGMEESFLLDPSITRGLDYYTGIVYETFLNDLPGIGSVCSGGRYNNLASLYTKQELPGVGSSIGLDRLMAAIEELGGTRTESGSTDIIIACLDKNDFREYYRIAGLFRDMGFKTEVFLSKKKLSAQFAFAEKKKIPIMIICGEDELSQKKYSVRDLSSRENYSLLTMKEAEDRCRSILEKKNGS